MPVHEKASVFATRGSSPELSPAYLHCGRSGFAMLLLVLGCYACSPLEELDIYRKVAPGTPLTRESLVDAMQICPHGADLVTSYDLVRPMAKRQYNPHILFWNSQHELISASYFAGEYIKRVEAGTVVGDLNPQRAGWGGAYRQDVPPGYRLQLDHDTPNGYGRRSHSVLDAIGLSDDGTTVSMRVRKARGFFGYPPDTPSGFPGVTTRTRTVPLCEIRFTKHDREQAWVHLRERDSGGIHWNRIRVPRPALLDEFRESLWQHLRSVREQR